MRAGAARYQTQVSPLIPAAEPGLRAALVGAVIPGVIVSRHLLRSDGLTDADPQQATDLLRPCLRALLRAGEPGALTERQTPPAG
jgi:Tetracyclin repressor-like, C-terminal domain